MDAPATDLHDLNIFAVPLGSWRVAAPVVAFPLAPDVEVVFQPGEVRLVAIAPCVVVDRTDGVPRLSRARREARTLWSAKLPSKPPFTAPAASATEDPVGTERLLRRWWVRQSTRFAPTCRAGTIPLFEEFVRTAAALSGAPLHGFRIESSMGASTPSVTVQGRYKGSADLHRLLSALALAVYPTGIRAHQGGALFQDFGLQAIDYGQPEAGLDKPSSAHQRMQLFAQAERLIAALESAEAPIATEHAERLRGLLKALAAKV